ITSPDRPTRDERRASDRRSAGILVRDMAHPESLDASGFDPDVLARHAQFVRRLARGLVRDGDAADELTSRTFAAAVERRPDTGPGFRVWLQRVTVRLFLRDR